MSARPHEHLEELIAAEALDGLDEADREQLARELAEHGPGCSKCRRLIEEYAEVAGRLAMAVDPVPLSTGAEERMLRQLRKERAQGDSDPKLTGLPSAHETPPAPAEGSPQPKVGGLERSHAPRWIVAAAVAAAMAVVGGVVGYTTAQHAEGIRVVELAGVQGQQLAVAYQPGRPNGWVIGSNLPQLEGGKVYELWFRRPGSSAMEPGGTFVPRDGAVVAPATLSDDVDLLAVTIEPAGGSLSPTSDPIFTSTVESSDRPTP